MTLGLRGRAMAAAGMVSARAREARLLVGGVCWETGWTETLPASESCAHDNDDDGAMAQPARCADAPRAGTQRGRGESRAGQQGETGAPLVAHTRAHAHSGVLRTARPRMRRRPPSKATYLTDREALHRREEEGEDRKHTHRETWRERGVLFSDA